MVKIAFSGKFASGKSTAAAIVKELLPETEIISFAAKIKELAHELFGMVEKDRGLLQDLGTKMREINKNVWVNYAIDKARQFEYIVIDDLRFENEYKRLNEEGYILIRLDIDPESQLKRLQEIYPNTWEDQIKKMEHPSEIALDHTPFDVVYDNSDNDIEKLKCFIQQVIGINALTKE